MARGPVPQGEPKGLPPPPPSDPSLHSLSFSAASKSTRVSASLPHLVPLTIRVATVSLHAQHAEEEGRRFGLAAVLLHDESDLVEAQLDYWESQEHDVVVFLHKPDPETLRLVRQRLVSVVGSRACLHFYFFFFVFFVEFALLVCLSHANGSSTVLRRPSNGPPRWLPTNTGWFAGTS